MILKSEDLRIFICKERQKFAFVGDRANEIHFALECKMRIICVLLAPPWENERSE